MPDINLKQGATLTRSWQFLNADNSNYDLTGCTLSMKIRQNYASQNPILDCSSYITIQSPATNGYAYLDVPHSVTAALPNKPATWVFDVDLTLANGTVVHCEGGDAVYAATADR